MTPLNLYQALLNGLCPKRCVFCGFETGAAGSSICTPCYADLPWHGAAKVPLPGSFAAMVAPLEYAFPVDAAIKAFKFRRRLFYAPAFAALLSDAAVELDDDIDAVAPVPLHWRRQLLRGFNQADELARPLARQLRVPMMPGLYRCVATRYQSGLSKRQRRNNVAAVFAYKTKQVPRHVLLVDDVITTGSTVRALASVLRRAGVEKVSVLALAQTAVAMH